MSAAASQAPLLQARAHFEQGLAHWQSGQLAEAEQAFAQAHALAPERPSVLTNLGAVRAAMGRVGEAVELLGRATQLEPDNVEAWGHLGASLAELGRFADALQALDRMLQLRPDAWAALRHKASVLRELGRLDASAQCLEQLHAAGAGDELSHYMLAAVRSGAVRAAGAAPAEAPVTAPAGYVEGLFDRYADEFSDHLDALHYRAPQVLAEGAARCLCAPWPTVLDLGCGTGLMGRYLQPHAQRLDGVDLSARMVERARQSGYYAEVMHSDLHAALAAAQAQGRRYALVVSADVFIYVGALERVFEGVNRILLPGGGFAFSVELLAPGRGDFAVQPSLRYAHAQAYVERLAASHGLRVVQLQHGPLREDQRQAIAGLYGFLQAPA